MAATLHYFMLPADEVSLLRQLEHREVTLYPELVPPGWKPLQVGPEVQPALDLPAYYLAMERLGPVVAHPVKRGPDKGMMKIEEVPSPVMHYERSVRNEAGEILAGRLWAELDITDDPYDRKGKPRALRALFLEVQEFFKKSWRRSEPKGYWIGPHAATAWKRGEVVFREPGHRGEIIGVWK